MGLTFKMLKSKILDKKRKQKLFLIPYFFTFASAAFGFFSVIQTLEGNFVVAAYCIMLAGIMDAFDGRLARALGSSSYLGMELDSLCDAVSFCFAPAILLYSWQLYNLGLFGVVILTFYLCCGLLRLAKFNITSASKLKEIGFFVGLPTTLAAFLAAQVVINNQWISQNLFPFLQNPIGIALFVLVLAFLMVSPIRFLSFKKINPQLAILGGFLLSILLVVSIWQSIPLFFLGLFSYLLSCVLYFAHSLIANKFEYF